jgi:hypothetical protein
MSLKRLKRQLPRLPNRAEPKQLHHRDYIFGTCGIGTFAYVSNTRTRVCQALRLHTQRIEMQLDEKEGVLAQSSRSEVQAAPVSAP